MEQEALQHKWKHDNYDDHTFYCLRRVGSYIPVDLYMYIHIRRFSATVFIHDSTFEVNSMLVGWDIVHAEKKVGVVTWSFVAGKITLYTLTSSILELVGTGKTELSNRKWWCTLIKL